MKYGITLAAPSLGSADGLGNAESPSASQMAVTVCGSFRRDASALRSDYSELVEAGCAIVSPRTLEWATEKDGFVFAADEVGRLPGEIEHDHLTAMRSSHFVWLHAPEGYVGRSAAMELGYAHALGLQVFSRELPADVTLAALVTKVSSPAAAVTSAYSGSPPAPSLGVDALQRYYLRAAVARGWEKETAPECVDLLAEEVKELGEAVTDEAPSSSEVALEMADVQLYLVHLANVVGIDLAQALVEKERLNTVRFGSAFPDAA